MGVPIRFLGRMMFFASGFQYFEVKGRRVSSLEAPFLICAPHSSFFDIAIMFVSSLPSGVSRIENGQAYLFGSMYDFFLLLGLQSCCCLVLLFLWLSYNQALPFFSSSILT